MDLVRLGVWGVVVFLVASVVVGPERARDGAALLWLRILRFWKVELFLGSKLVKSLRARFRCGFVQPSKAAPIPPHSCPCFFHFGRKNAFSCVMRANLISTTLPSFC